MATRRRGMGKGKRLGMMVKRKGNPKYKPIKKWMSTKKSMGIFQSVRYIRNEKPYTFKIKQGGKLNVFARNKNEATKKAKSWERWIKKRGFTPQNVITR